MSLRKIIWKSIWKWMGKLLTFQKLLNRMDMMWYIAFLQMILFLILKDRKYGMVDDQLLLFQPEGSAGKMRDKPASWAARSKLIWLSLIPRTRLVALITLMVLQMLLFKWELFQSSTVSSRKIPFSIKSRLVGGLAQTTVN